MHSARSLICAFLIAFGGDSSALAQSATQTRVLYQSVPKKFRVEVDGLGGGAPTGWTSFWIGTSRSGYGELSTPGAGQATLVGGSAHSCALTSAGGVKCWGSNQKGELGDGSTTNRLAPVNVSGLTNGVIAIGAGGSHGCAVLDSGGVKCWGFNDHGQVGDGSIANRLTPRDVAGLTSGIVSVEPGETHTCALTDRGAVKCWGANNAGQIGDGSTTDRRTPVNVSGLSNGVVALSNGGLFHNCAVTDAGRLKCWGDNRYGQLGDGTTTNRPSPVDAVGLPASVVAVAAGYWHTCALTRAGAVRCWGLNDNGEVGDGSVTVRRKPVDVVGLGNGVVAAISAGIHHSCALTRGGGVKCWGFNGYGQVGDGASADRAAPVDVTGLTSGVAAVAGGGHHSCALLVGGGARCWGHGVYGQLGDGAGVDRRTPVVAQSFSGLVRARADASVMPNLATGVYWLRGYYRGDATHAPSLGGLRYRAP